MSKGYYLSAMMLVAVASQDCRAIEGGFNVSGDRWAHAVRIESASGSCSATVITPKYAITAAHCVKSGEWSARVLSGDASEVSIGTASLAFVDPRYEAEGYSYDVAVLSLTLTPGDANTKNKIVLLSSHTYLEMLNAKSPYRTVLVVGHGRDERDRLGVRKAATVSNLTPHVGKGEMLWASHRPVAGATRPGDSGGGIYMLRESRMELAAVTSGDNTLTYKIDGDSFESTIERYAPIAPSLCKAPSEIRAALAFDATECAAIEATRKQLSTDFNQATLPLLLHMTRLLNHSPQHSIIGNDYLMQELAVKALVLGSRSLHIGDVVVNYFRDIPIGREDSERWRKLARTTSDALISDGRIEERIGGQSARTPGGIVKALEAARPAWQTVARIAYPTALKNGEPCPFDNCLKRNEASIRLSISSAQDDWAKIFPADPASEPFSQPKGLREAQQLVCRLVDYTVQGKSHFVNDLLNSGVSESKISTFDSGDKRSIQVGQGVIRFDSTFKDRFLEVNIYNVKLVESDIADLTRLLLSYGYILKQDDYGFTADKGADHYVSLFQSGDSYSLWIQEDWASHSYPSEFDVWGCSEENEEIDTRSN